MRKYKSAFIKKCIQIAPLGWKACHVCVDGRPYLHVNTSYSLHIIQPVWSLWLMGAGEGLMPPQLCNTHGMGVILCAHLASCPIACVLASSSPPPDSLKAEQSGGWHHQHQHQQQRKDPLCSTDSRASFWEETPTHIQVGIVVIDVKQL